MMRMGSRCWIACARSSRAPACPLRIRSSRRRASGACRCSASSSWPGGCSANEFVAVTGTNGKTTTVELIGHIHRAAGLPVAVAGNVGTAVSSLIGSLDPRATVVCEVSSFQLEDSSWFAPGGGRAAEHHARPPRPARHARGLHGGQAADLRAPGRARRRRAPARAGGEDRHGRAPGRLRLGAAGVAVRARRPAVVARTRRCSRSTSCACAGATTSRTRWPPRPSAWRAGSSPTRCARGLRSFAGVAHRLEEVATLDGVLYVNDSKATNVASTLVALDAFAGRRIHLIAGGQGKGQDFAALREAVGARLRGRLPDRRRRARARRGAGRRRDAGARLHRPGRRVARGARGGARGTWCCSRRPARASTSSRTSRRGEIASARWSGKWRLRPAHVEVSRDAGSRSRAREPLGDSSRAQQPQARQAESPSRRAGSRSSSGILLTADAVPAGVRRGDGLQRLLGDQPAAGPGQRQRLPREVPRLRNDRLGADARAGARRGGQGQSITAPLLAVSFVLVLAVHIPHVGVSVNGARRWIGPGPFQFQPSELMKLALVLYAATLLAKRPQRVHDLRELVKPLLVVVGGACLLVVTQPDLGTAMVIAFTMTALLVAAGIPMRKLAIVGGSAFVVVDPLRAGQTVCAGAPDVVPGSLGARLQQRLSGRPGPDRDRLGRAVRRRPRASRCRRSSTCPRPRPTSSWP